MARRQITLSPSPISINSHPPPPFILTFIPSSFSLLGVIHINFTSFSFERRESQTQFGHKKKFAAILQRPEETSCFLFVIRTISVFYFAFWITAKHWVLLGTRLTIYHHQRQSSSDLSVFFFFLQLPYVNVCCNWLSVKNIIQHIFLFFVFFLNKNNNINKASIWDIPPPS